VKYAWGGRPGEIDVLGVDGDVVVAFECKNSILPTNTFELRTTFDYLEKAAAQLDRFRSALQSSEFRKQLHDRLGCMIPENPQIVSAIVLSNRLLAGSSFRGHPVRAVADLRSFLIYG